jgi:GGDEF domain-containing protein
MFRVGMRADAETAISNLIAKGELGFVLAVVATSVQHINERDGYEAGDRALEAFAGRLAGPIGAARRVYRWSATSFVVVSRSLRKIAPGEMDGATMVLFGVWPVDDARGLFHRIDEYVACHLARDQAA